MPKQPLSITTLDQERLCKRCNVSKKITSFCRKFRRRNRVTDQRHAVCRSCQEAASTSPTRYKKIRLRVLAALGDRCACCGESAPEFLTIDHIGNTGASHRRDVGATPRQVYLAIESEGFPPDKYQLLCFNCNCSIGSKGYCPHNPTVRYPVRRRAIPA